MQSLPANRAEHNANDAHAGVAHTVVKLGRPHKALTIWTTCFQSYHIGVNYRPRNTSLLDKTRVVWPLGTVYTDCAKCWEYV